MAKNIYDLFNERKYGVDYLVEGVSFDVDNAEPYEDLDEAVTRLENIIRESANETMEFQAACYLEDLVVESMMYDDFDEKKIASVLESTKGGRLAGAKEKIKKWWTKIKEWFASTFKTIVDFFKSGETLVIKYRNELTPAMKSSNVKVKMNRYYSPEKALSTIEGYIDKLEAAGVENQGKEAALRILGVDDRKEVGNAVKKAFVEKENDEMKISSLNPAIVLDWAGNKKVILDKLKKEQKMIDQDFKDILKQLEEDAKNAEGDEANAISNRIANFNFIMGIKNTVLNSQIACVKKASKDCTAIVRKVLSKSGKAADNDNDNNNSEEPASESFVPQFDNDNIEFLDGNEW